MVTVLLLFGSRISYGSYLGNPVRRNSQTSSVFDDDFFAWGRENTIYFVVRNVAVKPLDLGSEFSHHSIGILRTFPQLGGG